MAATAVVMCGVAGVQAQTDVTDTYMTNAGMTSTTGWTRTGTWDDTNISSGVTEAYGGWDSNTNNSYSCKQTVTLPKGVYKLTGYAFYRSQAAYNTDPDVSLAYMVAGDVKREVTTLSSLSRATYPDSRTEAVTAFYTDGDYLNTLYFTVDADNTKVTVGYEGTHNSSKAKSWFIAGAMKLYKVDIASVSSASPLDIAVINPYFDICVNGWTYTTGASNHGRATNQSGDISGGYFENWKWESYTGAIHQNVTVPNGSYTIKAAAFRDQLITDASDGDAVYVYGNSDQTLVSATTGTFYTVNTNVTGETLDFGVKSNVAKYRWMGIDNTSIQCTGLQLAYADNLPGTVVEAGKWYAVSLPLSTDYKISSVAAATISYTQDGTQIASNVTSFSDVPIAGNGTATLSLNSGRLYVKANVTTTISINVAAYDFTTGQDVTSFFITNPGFEDDAAAINVTSSTLDVVTGWTLATTDNTNDVGVREYSNATYASLNGVGSYCFNSYWEGKPLTQTLSGVPAGTYELSALVTTGNATSTGTVYLNVGDAHSTGYARKSANANYYHREKLVFTLTSAQDVTIGIRGGSDVAGTAKKGAWNENGYWWYKCDDFKLTYLCEPTQAKLYSQLQTLLASCAPWTSGDEYATSYATYAAYTASNTVAELTTAVDYLNNEYEKYAIEYATTTNPYELDVISNADYSNGTTDWATAVNQTGGGSYNVTSDGFQTNFFQSTYNTWMRHSSVYQEGIVLDEGIYKLSAKMKGSPKDDESTFMYATLGSVAHWEDPVFKGTTYYGYLTTDVAGSWSTVSAYLTLSAPATVRIGVLSWGNNYSGGTGGAFSVDDWKIEKIDYAISTKADVATVVGAAPLAAINSALTSDIAVVDLQSATGLSSAAISTTNNPNLLVFANSGQVSNTQNVVVDGTCANLQLTSGHPFVNPTAFTATSATYTLGSSYLAGGNLATLMIPFAATTLAGTAYALDQDIDLIDGNVRGTAVSTVAANSPVLVTASGSYSGSSVAVPVVASGATYTNGQLVGTYTATTAPAGSYVLQNHTGGEGVAFYLVGSTRPTVGPFRAYIKAQGSEAKAIRVQLDDEADAIEAVSMDAQAEGATYFTTDGRRLSAPQRGINLVRRADGTVRKILVK